MDKGKAIKDGMISPFVQSQMRELGAKKSYPLVFLLMVMMQRVSNEFKIFTNIKHYHC